MGLEEVYYGICATGELQGTRILTYVEIFMDKKRMQSIKI